MSVCEALISDRLFDMLCPAYCVKYLPTSYDACIFWNRDYGVASCANQINFCSVIVISGGFLLNCDRYLQTCLLALALQGFQAALRLNL
jgi:hypothetical protein